MLRIGQHVADVRVGPHADGVVRVDRGRRRIRDEVLVEAVGDGLVAEPFRDPPAEGLPDDRAFDRVKLQPSLLEAFGPLGGYRVRDLVREVAVAGLADVVALLGVGLEAVPRLAEHLDDVPLGHTLFDPPRQDLGRGLGAASLGVEAERFVGADEHDAGRFQPVLDLRRGVRPATHTRDVLGDHNVEATVWPNSLVEQVLNTSVPRDRNLEQLVRVAAPAVGEVLATGLDVVEVRDDYRVVRQRAVARPQLPRDRQGRVLLVVSRGPPDECNANERGFSVRGWIRERMGAIYAARPCPFSDRFWATHSVTSRSTRACSNRSCSASAPSASRISKTISGTSSELKRPDF
nr:hypothetical protein [Lentzea albidocapillata]